MSVSSSGLFRHVHRQAYPHTHIHVTHSLSHTHTNYIYKNNEIRCTLNYQIYEKIWLGKINILWFWSSRINKMSYTFICFCLIGMWLINNYIWLMWVIAYFFCSVLNWLWTYFPISGLLYKTSHHNVLIADLSVSSCRPVSVFSMCLQPPYDSIYL